MTAKQIEAILNAVAKKKASEGVAKAGELLGGIPGIGGTLAAGLQGALGHVGVDAAVEWLTGIGIDFGRDLLKHMFGDDYGAVIQAAKITWKDNR